LPDYLSLISSQPGGYDELAGVLRTLATQLDRAGDAVNRARSRASSDWTGRSAQAFNAAVGATLSDMERAGGAATAASRVLSAAASELGAAVTEIRTFVASAEAAGFLVLPEGVVMIGPAQEAEAAAAGPGAPEVLAAYESAAAELTADLEGLVAAATAADESFAAALREPIAALSGAGADGGSGGPSTAAGWREGDPIPPPRTGNVLPTDAQLQPAFRGENDANDPKRAFFPATVHYMSPAERETHRLFVDGDGNLRSAADGSLFDTTGTSTAWSGSGRAIFVMDGSGNLYASPVQQVGYLHHSSLLAGASVAGAGEIEVNNGQLVAMTDRSGHYRPAPVMNDRVLDQLRTQGLRTAPGFNQYGWDNVVR
jgi:uncharacterized protein YukE